MIDRNTSGGVDLLRRVLMGSVRAEYRHHVMGYLAQYLLRRPLLPYPCPVPLSPAATRVIPFTPNSALEETVLLLLLQSSHLLTNIAEPFLKNISRVKDALVFALSYANDQAGIIEVRPPEAFPSSLPFDFSFVPLLLLPSAFFRSCCPSAILKAGCTSELSGQVLTTGFPFFHHCLCLLGLGVSGQGWRRGSASLGGPRNGLCWVGACSYFIVLLAAIPFSKRLHLKCSTAACLFLQAGTGCLGCQAAAILCPG